MKSLRCIAIAIALVVASIGAATAQSNIGDLGFNKSTIGTLVGAGIGGFAGSQIGKGTTQLVATGIGVLGGAMLGREVGVSLERADATFNGQAAMPQAFGNTSTPIYSGGQSIGGILPASYVRGSVYPTPASYADSRNYVAAPASRVVAAGMTGTCREFTQEITIGGVKTQAYGTACRQPDGSWRIQP